MRLGDECRFPYTLHVLASYSVMALCASEFPIRLNIYIPTDRYTHRFILLSLQFAFTFGLMEAPVLILYIFNLLSHSHSSFAVAFALCTNGISALHPERSSSNMVAAIRTTMSAEHQGKHCHQKEGPGTVAESVEHWSRLREVMGSNLG